MRRAFIPRLRPAAAGAAARGAGGLGNLTWHSSAEAKMGGMEYSNENAKRLQRIYLTGDVTAQRAETIRQLNLSAGESVLDIGCGPAISAKAWRRSLGLMVLSSVSMCRLT
jgi:hypothetical protein